MLVWNLHILPRSNIVWAINKTPRRNADFRKSSRLIAVPLSCWKNTSEQQKRGMCILNQKIKKLNYRPLMSFYNITNNIEFDLFWMCLWRTRPSLRGHCCSSTDEDIIWIFAYNIIQSRCNSQVVYSWLIAVCVNTAAIICVFKQIHV